MSGGRRSSRVAWICRGLAVLAATTALLRVGLTVRTFTNTVDEPFHLGAGVMLWDVGVNALGSEHPPLARLVAAMPLYLAGARVPPELRRTTVLNDADSSEAGARILFDNALSYEQMLTRARLAMLVFPAVSMLYVYLLARWAASCGARPEGGDDAGELAGLLAVVFVSIDPTFLGHALWVTTDAAAAAGFLAATFHGLRWIGRRTWGTALGAGLAVGLGIACKFTCLLVVPALLLILVIRDVAARRTRAPRDGQPPRATRRTLAQLGASIVVAFAAIWAAYLFDVGTLGDQRAFRESAPQWQMIPDWVKQAPVPMPSFGLGLLRLLSHNRWGHASYLNGEISRWGWWYYFPEAIVLKSPLALPAALLAALAATVVTLVRRRGRTPDLGRAAQVALVAAVFLALAMSGNLNIGIRHVLPVVPILYLLAVVVLLRARLGALLLVLAAVSAAETGAVHPDYVAFFNVAAGGTARGERFLIDSNLDWGQDVGRLARWLQSPEASGRPCALHLFAFPARDLVAQLGLDSRAVGRVPSRGGLLAISKNIRHGLMGVELLPDGSMRQTADYSWLSRYPLVKRIGTSIEVYDLAAPARGLTRSRPGEPGSPGSAAAPRSGVARAP